MLRRRSNQPQRLAQVLVGWTVIVTKPGEDAVQGEVAAVGTEFIELHAAHQLNGGQPDELKGRLIIERPTGYIQLVGAPA